MDFAFMEDIVKKKLVLGEEDILSDSNESIHIGYGIDDRFVMPMGVAMISILENNKSESIAFHVLMETITDENIVYLEEIAQTYRTVIVIYYIKGKIFEKLPITEQFTKATYYRFLLTKTLKNIARRVIYLDADILCYGSIGSLKDMDLQGNVVAVVQDVEQVTKRQVSKLKLKKQSYFNAGFLYIDVVAWENQCVSEAALQFSFENLGELDWLDQDALNFVLNDKAIFIANQYNYLFDFSVKKNSHIEYLPEDIVFVHYAGRYKPWHAWCMHPRQKDFLQYMLISPWQKRRLIQPQNYKDMKKMARSYWFYGNIANSILWYIKYAYNKMKRSGE